VSWLLKCSLLNRKLICEAAVWVHLRTLHSVAAAASVVALDVAMDVEAGHRPLHGDYGM
jgi:hypothetical protein